MKEVLEIGSRDLASRTNDPRHQRVEDEVTDCAS
jgi:hypothetical protein